MSRFTYPDKKQAIVKQLPAFDSILDAISAYLLGIDAFLYLKFRSTTF